MNPENTHSPLRQWIPTLNAYRSALNNETGHERQNSSDSTASNSISIVPRGSDAQEEDAPLQNELSRVIPIDPKYDVNSIKVVHLPVDRILARIQKKSPFMLGLGTVGLDQSHLFESIVSDLAVRCVQRTNRKTLVVRRHTNPLTVPINNLFAPVHNGLYSDVNCIGLGQSKLEKQRWNNQIARLLNWKQEFELILFDLGDSSSHMMSRMGRLCDGIVVQLLETSNSRKAIDIFRKLQNDRLNIIGAWTLEQNEKSLAG